MRLSDVCRDPHDGTLSLTKVGAFAGLWTVHVAFLVESWRGKLEGPDYVYFAGAVAVLTGMPIASWFVGFLGPRLSGQAPAPPQAQNAQNAGGNPPQEVKP